MANRKTLLGISFTTRADFNVTIKNFKKLNTILKIPKLRSSSNATILLVLQVGKAHALSDGKEVLIIKVF